MIEFVLLFLLFYTWHMLGVTVGYHRLLSHRSFTCPKFIEYLFVLSGYLAFEGSPIWWASMHRAHHRYTDTELDPHSPRFGWMQAHFGWSYATHYPAHIDPSLQSKDLIKDPLYRFLEQGGKWRRAHVLAGIIGFGSRLVLLFTCGWTVALASLAAGLTVQQIPLLLNVVCHKPKLGYKTFAVDDDSVNVWWVALLTMGEGWHNNHHAFPGSARSGVLMHELDVSWLTLRILKFFGLVGWMNVPAPAKISREVISAPNI